MRKIKPSPGQKIFPSMEPQPPPQRPERTSARDVIVQIELNPHNEARDMVVHLITSGCIVLASEMESGDDVIIELMRQERLSLKYLVQRIAYGNIATSIQQQDKALAIWTNFNRRQDVPLALALKDLGLCESTTQFSNPIAKNHKVAMFKFRRTMEKWRKKQD